VKHFEDRIDKTPPEKFGRASLFVDNVVGESCHGTFINSSSKDVKLTARSKNPRACRPGPSCPVGDLASQLEDPGASPQRAAGTHPSGKAPIWGHERCLGGLFAGVAVLLLGVGSALGAGALSPERYGSLDAAYTAMIPLDRDRVPAAALAAAQRACERLDRADPLLAALRVTCLDVVRAVRVGERFGRCRGREGCRRASAAVRKVLSRLVRDDRFANRAIDASVTDQACRVALRTSARELDETRRLVLALRRLEHALKRGSRAEIRRAERRVYSTGPGRSATQERQRFRSACG
jgi:hypothetical protein